MKNIYIIFIKDILKFIFNLFNFSKLFLFKKYLFILVKTHILFFKNYKNDNFYHFKLNLIKSIIIIINKNIYKIIFKLKNHIKIFNIEKN